METPLASELGVLGPISWVEVLKVWMLDVMWVQILSSQGEARSCDFFFPEYMSFCWGLGLWQGCISTSPTHFSVEVFLVYLMCRSSSASF